ncbi:hypothetical protein L7F22_013369 [Adiantum nelumboides]|nr:hypothetical protein [Adiantum nelumboides]
MAWFGDSGSGCSTYSDLFKALDTRHQCFDARLRSCWSNFSWRLFGSRVGCLLFTLASKSSDKARKALASVVSLASHIVVLVDSGAKAPVVEVASAMDERSFTGELVLVGKEVGATVWAGTLSITDDAAEPALMESWRRQGWSISLVGLDEKLAGIMCTGDPLRVEAQEFVQKMKKFGLHLVMLTGDSLAPTTVAQKKLGELEVYTQLFPQDKVDLLLRIKSKLGCTSMVGDGINDAMGVVGSAVAMETADVALMTNDLRQLVAVVKLGGVHTGRSGRM